MPSERRELPVTRSGKTKKIHLHYVQDKTPKDLKIYVTTGEYEDGQPGEVFLKADKAGSTISGLLDALSITMSLGLQYGVPLQKILDKLVNLRFEPKGTTDDPDMPRVCSIVDAVAKWLAARYPTVSG
jgi:ribonucleoside-diphosphate reductase alpha chain